MRASDKGKILSQRCLVGGLDCVAHFIGTAWIDYDRSILPELLAPVSIDVVLLQWGS